MATLSTPLRNAAANAIVDFLDQGTTISYPYIKFETEGHAEVARCYFTDATAFDDAGDTEAGVAYALTIADDNHAEGGTIHHVGLYDKDNVERITASIAVDGSGDFQIDSLVVGVGDSVGVTSLKLTIPVSS